MGTRHVYFITSNPQLTAHHPYLTNAKDPNRDMVQFARSVNNALTAKDLWLLPSGAMSPAILAGRVLSVLDKVLGDTTIVHPIAVSAERVKYGLKPRSPYNLTNNQQHKSILMHLANRISQNILKYPYDGHVITESVPGGTLTALIRAERSGIKIDRRISSLHPEDDAEAFAMRESTLNYLLRDADFDAVDDFAEITSAVSATLAIYKADNIYLHLSGGLMPAAAVSQLLTHRQMHNNLLLYPNPLFFRDKLREYQEQLQTRAFMYTAPEALPTGVKDLQGILSKFPSTEPYVRGRVGDGAGLGYALASFAKAIYGHDAPRSQLIAALDESLNNSEQIIGKIKR